MRGDKAVVAAVAVRREGGFKSLCRLKQQCRFGPDVADCCVDGLKANSLLVDE